MSLNANKPVVILGAGLAGLTAANFLRQNNIPVLLFEAGNKIAGLAQSFHDKDGFTYDFGAHFITNRLAKAVGIPGGVILSDKKTVAAIRQNPLFVGASPIVPAYLFAFLKAQKTYTAARAVLQKNIQQFETALPTCSNVPISYLPDYPVFFTPQTDLFDFLLTHKIMISSFSYPNPTDPPITRIILSALHTEGDIDFLSDKLREISNID